MGMNYALKKSSYIIKILLSKNTSIYGANYILLTQIITLLKNQDTSDLIKEELRIFLNILWSGIEFYQVFFPHFNDRSFRECYINFITQECKQKTIKNTN